MRLSRTTGPECVCGLNGCLTTRIGALALREEAQRRARAIPGHPFAEELPRIREMLLHARNGDAVSIGVLNDMAAALGIAVTGLLNLMNPQRIILGGQLSEADELLIGPLRRYVAERSLITSVQAASIVRAELGERSVALGAATMQDMGKVMGQLKGELSGRADMAQVSQLVRAKLSGN